MTSQDSARGGVDVFVRSRAAFDAALAERQIGLPARTTITEVPYLVQTEAVFVGGEPTTSATTICTLGYAVFFTQDSTRGYTTAGHCDNARTYAGVTLTLKSQLDTGARDLQWHVAQTGTHSYSPSIDLQNGTYRYVYYQMPLASMQDGNPVCMVGDSSGYRCGTIYRHDVQWRGQCCMVWVKPTSGDLSRVGDSGGPWFYANTAYGSHVGNPAGFTNDAIFMPISYLPEWGLALLAATPP